jgi:hypothetical protein
MRNLKRSGLGVILTVVVMAAFAAGPALAQDDPSTAQYGSNIPDSGTASSAASGGSGSGGGLDSNIGSLPFTGMDLLIVGGVALVLTGTGFALRRLSTPRGPIA